MDNNVHHSQAQQVGRAQLFLNLYTNVTMCTSVQFSSGGPEHSKHLAMPLA